MVKHSNLTNVMVTFIFKVHVFIEKREIFLYFSWVYTMDYKGDFLKFTLNCNHRGFFRD